MKTAVFVRLFFFMLDLKCSITCVSNWAYLITICCTLVCKLLGIIRMTEVKRIVVLGGGTAGWLTAGVVAAEHCVHPQSSIQITLIESPDVPTVGVGEGTWPSMRDTLRRIGISEFDLFSCADASFKQGSKFVNWRDGQQGDYYYHPFVVPRGYFDCNLVPFWQHNLDLAFESAFSCQGQLCELGYAPKQNSTPPYAAVNNYGYHLNAGKFADLLKNHAIENLNVQYIADHVDEIIPTTDGDVRALRTRNSGLLEGDLFVDCSGLQSLLVGEFLKTPFVDKVEYLFNDRAIAVQVPYDQEDQAIFPATISTAQECGWIWDIGLPTRRGVGYVYSSLYSDEERALDVLHKYIENSANLDFQTLKHKSLTIRPGHREKFWVRNCVAVGMASGFIEPLEASALAMVEFSASMIRDQLPANREVMDIVAKRFNERFTYRWDRIVDFLKLHYVLSKRGDTQYWKDNRSESSIPESLKELLALWEYNAPSRHDFSRTEEVFPAASFLYVMNGMSRPSANMVSTKASSNYDLAKRFFEENKEVLAKFKAGLPSNRQAVEFMRQKGRAF